MVRNKDRVSATPRAILFIGDRSFRVDLYDALGGIPDWVFWQVDDYKYVTLQDYALCPAEELAPRFDLVIWEDSPSGYVQEHSIVVLCALQGSDVYISKRIPHYEHDTSVIRNVSFDQMVERCNEISRRNLRRKLNKRKSYVNR